MSTRFPRRAVLLPLAVTAALALASCADPVGGATTEVAAPGGHGIRINNSPDQHRVRTEKAAALAAEVPAAVRDRGVLRIVGSAESSPPLGFYATDDRTRIGVEIDLAYLVAETLGLRPQFSTASWENVFVGLDSGRYDVGFSNITDTEERKKKYDFASYRKDDIAFEARRGSGLKVRDYRDVAGRTVAVNSGTNQERILLEWSRKAQRAGLEPVDVKYYKAAGDIYLALASGRIDLYLGPDPTSAYHVAAAGKTEIAGTTSGAGTRQGLISATTRKGNGLVGPLADAVNEIIGNGTYARVLRRWGLSAEAVHKSEVNPPGLPASDG
ncbi:ABC transporter substrate-binding protein [Streptomyces sp. NPDC059740]|uniref:ABC transporter substrate-binding protein n=1 Tax=Streptomyces sp. NPDC059740 TaxID=3346926 RepID=UPI00364A9E84